MAKRLQGLALRVAGIYLIVGVLWIILSDRLTALLASTPDSILRLQTFKGWAFVLVSSLLLYWIVRRQTADLERTETILQESQRWLTTLMSNLPGMVYRCRNDRDWTMEFVSGGSLALTGYTSAELVENRAAAYGRLIHPEDRERVWEEVQQALAARKPFEMVYRLKTKSGEERWVWEQGCGVYGLDGKLVALEGYASDITQHKQLEENFRHAQKMEAVGQLAGGIAHDFNNLLGVIIGYSELLMEGMDSAHPDRRKLEEIKRAGDRAASLTRQLLAFSRKQHLELRVLDVNATLSDTAKMLQRLIGEHVKLVVVSGRGLGRVKADPGQLEQVILNLAVNARDAMPLGGTLTIETANVDLDEAYARAHGPVTPGQYVMLAVSDTGEGIPPENLSRIFDPFFTTKGPDKGTGLGLATVYGIVKQSGGFIWVYSELGQGTTFKLYLPRVQAPTERVEAHAALLPLQGTETVLLVEDAEGIRRLAQESLASRGYKVLEAADAATALRLAKSHPGPIHLLLTDVVLPDGGGRALCHAVLEHHPECKLLFMSGYTDDTIARQGVLGAGVAFLQKPFTLYALASKVREVLEAPATAPAEVTAPRT